MHKNTPKINRNPKIHNPSQFSGYALVDRHTRRQLWLEECVLYRHGLWIMRKDIYPIRSQCHFTNIGWSILSMSTNSGWPIQIQSALARIDSIAKNFDPMQVWHILEISLLYRQKSWTFLCHCCS